MPRILAWLLVVGLPCPSLACSICGATALQRLTMRQEASDAKFVVVGRLSNPRLKADGSGAVDISIERILKDHPALKGIRIISIPRYLPIDDKSPRFLVLGDVVKGKLDVVIGRFVKDERICDYLKAVQDQAADDPVKRLRFFFPYLDSPVADIAADAYLEFAKATDQDVGRASQFLDPDRLRRLLKSETTPSDRLGLLAFLLGGCGTARDADFLLELMRRDTENTRSALSGLLTGYIVLRPADGWKLAASIISDPRRKFLERFASISAVRFFQAWKPSSFRTEKLTVLAAAVENGEVADMAIEDLRRWQWWELSKPVLAKYGLKSHDAPLVKRSILRYALSCPDKNAHVFIAARRRDQPDQVADAAESLEAEK